MNDESARMQLTKASLQNEMEKNWTIKAFFSSTLGWLPEGGEGGEKRFWIARAIDFSPLKQTVLKEWGMNSFFDAIETTVLYSWTYIPHLFIMFFLSLPFKQRGFLSFVCRSELAHSIIVIINISASLSIFFDIEITWIIFLWIKIF